MMNKLCAKAAVLATALLAAAGMAEATPVTYDFTATDFIALMGGSAPYSTVSGNFTLDGSTVTQIDLTIGAHTYSPSELTFDSTTSTLGGSLNGVSAIFASTDDFVLSVAPATPQAFLFGYTTAGVFNLFYASSGTVAPIVPVPASAWLLGSGLIGLAGVARKRKAA